MPRIELKKGGWIATTLKDVEPAVLTVRGTSGSTVFVELADLKEIEAVVKLIENPDEFEEV